MRYYVLSPIDSQEEVLVLPEQFNRKFVLLKKDEQMYFLDTRISDHQLKAFFEAYPKKEGRSLVFSRIADEILKV